LPRISAGQAAWANKERNGETGGSIMALWIFKQEPTCYSFSDLRRDGRTVWDGVGNALARKNLRQIKRGDLVLFYHTGKEKAVVGIMRAASDARDAPTPDDPKAVVVEVEPVGPLPRPVALAEIKAESALADWDFVRLPRLSVAPVTEAQWKRIEELSATRA
jgi:predicted RNA-binding protein with PUA-like domain